MHRLAVFATNRIYGITGMTLVLILLSSCVLAFYGRELHLLGAEVDE